jgi:flavin reductase (DIM6/NTAB) family NADH-FMN oxidoreductase RutF
VKEMGYNEEAARALTALGEGAFLTAGDAAQSNTMTIGWGSIGIVWRKPVFTVLVRPSRYTHEFIERGGEFTVSVPLGTLKPALGVCGSRSGRDGDKIAAAGLTLLPGRKVATPVIAGCGLYYECRVIGKQQLAAGMLEEAVNKDCYAAGDHHTVYYGEIVAAYSV